ncbi:MAG: DNA adenine methylase [Leptospiraceae bacterium]|nr:DNA adenine methylase [Leptospiraceae bacterium]
MITESKKVIIKKLNSDLTGSGFLNEKEFYFSYVLPEDEVIFETFGRGKRKFNKVYSIISNHDSIAKCNYFGKCGGCKAQHIDYKLQFQLKTKPIIDFYKSNFDLNLKTISNKDIYSYRNRMDFSVFPDEIGLRQEGNFRKVIDIDHCMIQKDIANQELMILRKILNPIIRYNRKLETGFLKYVTLRTSQNGKELMSILTFSESFRNTQEESELKEIILQNSIANSILFCYTRMKSEVSAQGEFEVIRGTSTLKEVILGQVFEIPFDGFFQPNPNGFLPILKFIEESIHDNRYNTLIDLFSGLGFFSLLFGERFMNVYGFDVVDSSIEKANLLLKNKFPKKRIHFYKMDLISETLQFKSYGVNEKESILILDPPRNGIGNKVISILENSEISKIFYVSCNPNSQLKDIMDMKSYKPIDGLIVDPYPHTPHLESVMLLEKIN